MNLVSNCPLCEEHGLHVMGEADGKIMQCLSCGYVSSEKFVGTKEDNTEYAKLPDEMKSWSKEEQRRIWVPTILTLPFGMLYPIAGENNDMKWEYAPLIEIPAEDRENYPDSSGGYYTKRFDKDSAKRYDTFLAAMVEVNEKAKKEGIVTDLKGTKLPKLKKVDNG